MIFLLICSGGGSTAHLLASPLKCPFRVIPQAAIAARTLLAATRRIIGAEGKLDQFEEYDSSRASKKSWRFYRVWGRVIFLSWFAFLFSFLFPFLEGRVSSSFNQMHFSTDEHCSKLHLLWKALGIQKQTPTAELNIAAGIQIVDKDSFTIVACLYRVRQF